MSRTLQGELNLSRVAACILANKAVLPGGSELLAVY
jgi:hypothetical protein